MLAGLLLVALQDPAIAWQPSLSAAIKRAGDDRGLALVSYRAPNDALCDEFVAKVLRDTSVVTISKKFACVDQILEEARPVKDGLVIASLPVVYFLDGEEKVMGHFFGSPSADMFAKWMEAVEDVWKRHDTLVFRSRGHLSERDTARLGFSFALRLETERAKSRLVLLPRTYKSEEVDFAYLALAQAEFIKGRRDRAVENWAFLETNSRSREARSWAKYWIGVTWMQDKPKGAATKFEELLKTDDAPVGAKWCASYQLAKITDKNSEG